MNHLYHFFYPTARHRITADQQALNYSEFHSIYKTFKDLKHEMNKSLYNMLLRFRDHHEAGFFPRVRPDFDFNLINRNYYSPLCDKLIKLLVGYNHEFMQLFHKFTFFYNFNESQRIQLKHTVIDGNDFVVYALFVIERTNDAPDRLKEIFYIFERNVKMFFFDIVSFKDYFKSLNVEDLAIPIWSYL